MADPLLELRNTVEVAAERLRDGESGRSAPNLERPPKPELGDYSTNAAMLLAPARGEPPREVAELLRDELGGRLGATAERIEVAGPGFLNLFLSERWYREGVAAVLALAGHDVQREYYVNDKGGQVRRFAESIAARMRGADVPEDGYEGAYVEELARELSAEGVDADDLDRLELLGAERMRAAASATLER